ncbi:MAG: ergothioneine biosynthesis protein EgtB [Gemmatimonadales bacterium]|nr:MAG: ergothioneine biosynthesis protein EgtB [Gemmatimonadales bacterium]
MPPLLDRYREVRGRTVGLTRGLAPEDQVVQSMEDVSPTKWHLAHTTWFWEVFLLAPHLPGHKPLDPRYHYLFNSYYTQAGERHCRDQRGYISRPTVAEVLAYREHVDEAMERLLAPGDLAPDVAWLVELGLNHEQQHQELVVTDLKHVFSVNPLRPAHPLLEGPASSGGDVEEGPSGPAGPSPDPGPLRWRSFPEGLHEIGWGGSGFAYDNEEPRHRRFVQGFELADRLVTNGEFLAFMEDGGYRRPELWMSAGFALVTERAWTEPFYWDERGGEWWMYTLAGMVPVDPAEPVCHLSWFEADAYARWAGARLPREEEWEVAARDVPMEGNLVESGRLHPTPAPTPAAAPELEPATGGPGASTDDAPPVPLRQLWGDVWEWTSSQYSPYPGFRAAPGAVGEYNGKFMCNQFVLRGGSCATPKSHLRPTYRNFFAPDATWQFTGVRLARDL